MGKGIDSEVDYVAYAYKIWQVDCPCGEVVSYDEDTYPDNCESCGAEVEVVTDG